mgnify:CR=1 FL=1
MNELVLAAIKKARIEAEKEVVSENMMGVDFSALLWECRPVVRFVREVEEFGRTEMQFKKGEW